MNEPNDRPTPVPTPGWLPPLPDAREEPLDPRLPPFRIHHILVWTACSAVFLSMQQGWFAKIATLSEYVDLRSPMILFQSAFGAIVLGGYWMICLMGVAWRRQAIAFPSQPGHWLAVFNGILYVSSLLPMSIGFLLMDESWNHPTWWLFTSTAIPLVVILCLIYMLVRAAALFGSSWKTTLIVLAIGLSLDFLAMLVMSMYWLFPLSSTIDSTEEVISTLSRLFGYGAHVCVGLAAWRDWRRDIARHWAHWIAVTIWLVSGVSDVVFEVVRVVLG